MSRTSEPTLMHKTRTSSRKRNRGFEETHQALIATAVRMLSEKGIEALSVSALAREVGLNRTTVYYHFPSREAMLKAVKDWSAKELARGMDVQAPQLERMGRISRFVLDNPLLIKLWIDDLIAPGNIRDLYPAWDELVAGLARNHAANNPDVPFDAEVYAVMMLTSAIIGPRVFQHSVAPDVDAETITQRFVAEQTRQLANEGLLQR